MLQKGILLICGFLAWTAFGATEYYTWIDENGITNYAQRNPGGYDAELVGSARPFGYQRQRGRPQAQQQVSSNAGLPADESGSNISIEVERAAMNRQIAEVKRSNCEMGKRNLAQLEAFHRIRVRDANGVEKLLSDEEKAQRMDETRQIIRENCTG